jgi:flagellar basal-body rod modification protein FlgD
VSDSETTLTGPVSGSNSIATNTATTTVTRDDQMDKNTFLKLLVAQMRYQDPSNPTDPAQFMSQTAVFTQVEKLDELVTQNASLVALQKSMSAGSLVGHTATYTDDSGVAQTGKVTSVVLGDDTTEATATIGGKPVPLGRITEVA